jgi:hypothetical protein
VTLTSFLSRAKDNQAGDAVESTSPGPKDRDLRRVVWTFLALSMVGPVGTFLYTFAGGRQLSILATFGGAVLLMSAFGFAGGLIGFVFAIPRSRQEQRAVQPAQQANEPQPPVRLSDYSANTNLEQISDWLTKIMIGIGLVEFKELSGLLWNTATTLAPMIGADASARPVALCLMMYSGLWGFFFAYLSTRLWLPKALTRAEREEEVQRRQVEREAELHSTERRAYDALYQKPPGGYTRAIEAIETYHAKRDSLRSPWLWAYLAAAYGQKHADEKKENNADGMTAAKDKAVAAVEEALRLGAETRPLLVALFRGADPNENDLASLQDDGRMKELLGGTTPP